MGNCMKIHKWYRTSTDSGESGLEGCDILDSPLILKVHVIYHERLYIAKNIDYYTINDFMYLKDFQTSIGKKSI